MNPLKSLFSTNKERVVFMELNEPLEQSESRLLHFINTSGPFKMMIESKKLTSIPESQIEIARVFNGPPITSRNYRSGMDIKADQNNVFLNFKIKNSHYFAKYLIVILVVINLLFEISTNEFLDLNRLLGILSFLAFAIVWELRNDYFLNKSSEEIVTALNEYFPKLRVLNEC